MARGEAILAAMAGISKKGPYAALARSRGTLTVVGSKLKPEYSARRSLAVQRQNSGVEAGKFRKHVAHDLFSGIIVGFALQKAWLSAQTEAQQVVCRVYDGSKTDSCRLAFRLACKEYKLGTKK